MNNQDQHPKEKTAQMFWTLFIMSFFLIQAVIWTVAISNTANDPSHAVVAGYDQKAMRWDETKAERLASDQLAWKPRLEIDSRGDIRGNRVITLSLYDQENQPITGAEISLAAFHRGRAADVQDLELTPINPGVYSGTVQVRHTGNWQFDGAATVDANQFLISDRQFITTNRGQ